MARTYSNDFFDSVIDCYHCYTDGNRADVMFPDTDAKVYGMNVIPALVRKAGTVMLAFVLMDNHVHFCLNGHEENCRRFMKLYVFAVANYLTKRFGQEYRGRGFKFSALAITTKGQLMKTIAYIFRNPLAAGFDRMPSEYRWSNAPDCFTGSGSVSSGNIIGRPYVATMNPTHARRLEYANVGDPSSGYVAPHHFRDIRTIGDLTMVERRNILKVRHQYPADWTFDEYGVALKCEDEVNDSMLRNTGAFLSDADVREKAKALSPYAA